MGWPDPSGEAVATADGPPAEVSDEPTSGNRFVFVVPNSAGPRIDIRWRFWRRPEVTVGGRELPHRGVLRGRRELVTLADGSQAELRLAGFLNRSVVVDGRRHPLERRLRGWELVLVGLPLLAMIPGPHGVGAVPVLVGLGGCRINAVLIRSARPRRRRIAGVLGVFLASIAIAITVSALGVFVLDEREGSGATGTSSGPPATLSGTRSPWPYQLGQCLEWPASPDSTLEDFHAVACSSPHLGEVIGLPRDPVADYPGAEPLDRFAEQACGTAFSQYVGRPFDELRDGYSWFTPVAFEFDAFQGTVLCIGTTADGSELRGPLGG